MVDSAVRRKAYLEANLTFASDKITWVSDLSDTREVQMSWEQPIHTKAAELCVEAGDHVLECGFGMGMLADAIQARNPASHTITESHPELITKAKAWAVGKSNVTIIEDTWWTLMSDTHTRYDAIFQLFAYADDLLHTKFRHFARNKAKQNCKITWWNFTAGTTDKYMLFECDSQTAWTENIVFTDITVDPPENTYFNQTTFKLPVITFTPTLTKIPGFKKGSKVHYNKDGANQTMNIENVGPSHNILSCSDPANPVLTPNTDGHEAWGVTTCGIWKINTNLLTVTGNQPMIIKRDGAWIEKNVRELVVGDKLYKIDNTEVEITKLDFDSSDDNVYNTVHLKLDHNYFVNDILIKKGGFTNA